LYKKESALWLVLELALCGSPLDVMRLTNAPLRDGDIGVRSYFFFDCSIGVDDDCLRFFVAIRK
jgi:hypothetical protein